MIILTQILLISTPQLVIKFTNTTIRITFDQLLSSSNQQLDNFFYQSTIQPTDIQISNDHVDLQFDQQIVISESHIISYNGSYLQDDKNQKIEYFSIPTNFIHVTNLVFEQQVQYNTSQIRVAHKLPILQNNQILNQAAKYYLLQQNTQLQFNVSQTINDIGGNFIDIEQFLITNTNSQIQLFLTLTLGSVFQLMSSQTYSHFGYSCGELNCYLLFGKLDQINQIEAPQNKTIVIYFHNQSMLNQLHVKMNGEDYLTNNQGLILVENIKQDVYLLELFNSTQSKYKIYISHANYRAAIVLYIDKSIFNYDFSIDLSQIEYKNEYKKKQDEVTPVEPDDSVNIVAIVVPIVVILVLAGIGIGLGYYFYKKKNSIQPKSKTKLEHIAQLQPEVQTEQ